MNAVRLDGKRVLITGAARGLGRSFAEAACRAGARVVIADINEEAGEASNELSHGSWFVHRRFSDFEWLHERLQVTDVPKKIPIPYPHFTTTCMHPQTHSPT